MVVAERVIRVPIQFCPSMNETARLMSGSAGMARATMTPPGPCGASGGDQSHTSVDAPKTARQFEAVALGNNSARSAQGMTAGPVTTRGPRPRPFRAPDQCIAPLRCRCNPFAFFLRSRLRRLGTLRRRFARHLADAFERWEALAGRRHDSTASTLHGIADVFCRYLSERSRGLRIPGCAGRTYRECFRPLENANRYVRHHACVLFAPIRFRRPPLRGRAITIEFTPAMRLSPRNANRRTRPDAVYRFSFHSGSWSESERDRFRRGRPARLDLPARGHRNSVREIPDKVKLRFALQHHQQSVPVPPSFPLEPERSFPAGQ